MKITVETLRLYQQLVEKPKSWLKSFLLTSPKVESSFARCPENVSDSEKETFYRVAGKSWLPGKSVLLVEDHPICGETLKNLMERWEMKVILVSNCAAAKKVNRSGLKFDFALIDHTLPDGTGDEVARAFYDEQANTSANLLSLSGNRYFAEESLYHASIEKPASPDSLRKEMVDLLISQANRSSSLSSVKSL